MEDLSDVQDAIKAEFANALARVDAPQLQLYTANNEQLIKIWKQLDGLSVEYFKGEGGLTLTIHLKPFPVQNSGANVLDGTNFSNSSRHCKKKKKTEWVVTTVEKKEYLQTNALFHLDDSYLAKTGLASKELTLYCRPTFHEQFRSSLGFIWKVMVVKLVFVLRAI